MNLNPRKTDVLFVQCRPMIHKPPAFKGVNIRIPSVIPIKGRGSLISGLGEGLEDLENDKPCSGLDLPQGMLIRP